MTVLANTPNRMEGAVTAPATQDRDGRTPLVQVRGLVKHYGKAVALRGIDLTVYDGEFLVLLGPSGCGKTTTMRCIAGLEEASSGTITVGGRVLFDAATGTDVPPNKRDMGMVFQSYALWPHKSVIQNVEFPLRMHKVPRAEVRSRAMEALHRVGLEGFENRSINTLSGGQMQRVALARAIVFNPRLLLLDEPLSNLDAKLRVRLRHELKEIQQALGVTSILVTHDQSEALGLADRIVVMDHGEIVQIGQPREMFKNPRNAFVADFLGMTNRVPVSVTSSSGGVASGVIAGSSSPASGVDRRERGDAEAIMCIRPDSVRPVPDAAAAGAVPNKWTGTVLSVQYQGTSNQVRIQLDDGPIVLAQGPGVGDLALHEKCVVAVAAEDCLVFDAPEPQ